MQLANQVNGVHLDAEIQTSRSPPGAASDAFLGGGGEFHARLPAHPAPCRHLLVGFTQGRDAFGPHPAEPEVTAASTRT